MPRDDGYGVQENPAKDALEPRKIGMMELSLHDVEGRSRCRQSISLDN